MRVATCIVVAAGLSLCGCAKPCFDDGLNQGGCPSNATEAATGGDGAANAGPADGSRPDDGADATAGATAGATSPSTGAMSAGGTGAECPVLDELLLPQTPTLQLVIDQSGSMDGDFGATTRWEAMRETLIGPGGVVSQLQSEIRFGVSLYRNAMQCPDVQEMAPQLDAADEITTLLDGEVPGGDTPTGESLVIITETLLADRWVGDKAIVLTTDGEPDTCAVPDPMTDAQVELARSTSVDAITAAFDAGIATYVISVGNDVGAEHLQDLANAGAGNAAGDPDATFYIANDPQALIDAFDAIVAGIRSCRFALADPLPASQAATCVLTVNGTVVTQDDPNGWAQNNDSEIELMGDACVEIQQGVVVVQMACACEGPR